MAAALIAGVFAACAPQRIDEGGLPPNPNASDEEEFLEFKAVIQEVSETSLLVAPIEGLDYIDIIYLHIGDETVLVIANLSRNPVDEYGITGLPIGEVTALHGADSVAPVTDGVYRPVPTLPGKSALIISIVQ